MSKFKKKKGGGTPGISTASLPDIEFVTYHIETMVKLRQNFFIVDRAKVILDQEENWIMQYRTKRIKMS